VGVERELSTPRPGDNVICICILLHYSVPHVLPKSDKREYKRLTPKPIHIPTHAHAEPATQRHNMTCPAASRSLQSQPIFPLTTPHPGLIQRNLISRSIQRRKPFRRRIILVSITPTHLRNIQHNRFIRIWLREQDRHRKQY